MKLLIGILTAVLLAGSAECGAAPRIFVEAEISASDLLDEQLIRAGVQSSVWRFFAGFYRRHVDDDVNEPGWYSQGVNQIQVGGHWFTTKNPQAIIVPCFGGGAVLGFRNTKFNSWNWDTSGIEPQLYLEERPVDETSAMGVFADTGVKFRIKPTNLMLSANFHWNLTTWSRSTTQSDAYDYEKIDEQLGMLSGTLMVGASYRF